jgi:hypothetical protein
MDETQREALIVEIMQRLERRGVLAGGAGLLTGAGIVAGASGNAEAGTNQVGTLGTDNNRLDIEGEDLDLTDQSSTPQDPGTGQVRMYFKNGTPYYKPNGGSETAFGGGGTTDVWDTNGNGTQSLLTGDTAPASGDGEDGDLYVEY